MNKKVETMEGKLQSSDKGSSGSRVINVKYDALRSRALTQFKAVQPLQSKISSNAFVNGFLGVLDKLGLRLYWALRHQVGRILIITYLLMVHIWVCILSYSHHHILGVYSGEAHVHPNQALMGRG